MRPLYIVFLACFPLVTWSQVTWYDARAVDNQMAALYEFKVRVKDDLTDDPVDGAYVFLYKLMDDGIPEFWEGQETVDGEAFFSVEPGTYQLGLDREGEEMWYSKKPSQSSANLLHIYRKTSRTMRVSSPPVLEEQPGNGIIAIEDAQFSLQCDCPADVYAWVGHRRLPSTWVWVDGTTLSVNPRSNVPPGPFYVTDKRTGAKSNEVPFILVDDEDQMACVMANAGMGTPIPCM
jgi:hypothetical protein